MTQYLLGLMSVRLINNWFIIVLLGLIIPKCCQALEPYEVLVVANGEADSSVYLAKYYMQKRKIPRFNLIEIYTKASESCSRTAYKKEIATPIKEYLEDIDNRWRIRCVVLVYGVPLKINPGITELVNNQLQGQSSDRILKDDAASVDSELALVRVDDYPLGGRILNPYYRSIRKGEAQIEKEDILMVSRLDGSNTGVVKRIIDDSLHAEKKGLKGIAYFDARWPIDETRQRKAYGVYDRSVHLAAERVQESGRLKAVLNDSEALFQEGACKKAALYCGWYSLGNYIDAFRWQTGAVGYHIASAECITLKKKDSRVWCKRMLEKGIAATLGPVGEPYVDAFPLPDLFFTLLLEGNLSLAEVYLATNPYFSWKMVLIGDPLYRPFGKS